MRVLNIAQRLGYQPHASAQSLARNKSHLVSAIIPVLTNDFYLGLMRGMQDALAESGYDLIVYAANRPEEINGQFARASQKGRAEGLLMLSIPLEKSHAKLLKQQKQCVVLVDEFHPDFDSISVDNVKGGYMATQHLLEQGHEQIAHITLDPGPPPAQQRRLGYEKAMVEAGFAIDHSLIATRDRRPHGFIEDTGYESMQVLLQNKTIPTAVFVASDIQALGALRAIQEAGLKVPDDIALVGFDDIKVSQYIGLSTLRQPVYEMGKLAVEKLLMRIRNPDHPVTHTVFSPTLIARTSSTGSETVQDGHLGHPQALST